MDEKQRKRDREDNMFIKRRRVYHRDHAGGEKKKKRLQGQREHYRHKESGERERERNEKQWRGSGKYIKRVMMELEFERRGAGNKRRVEERRRRADLY